jgi:hypothetical protein
MQRPLIGCGLFLAALAMVSLAGLPVGGAATKAEAPAKKVVKAESRVALLLKKLKQPITLDKGIDANTPLKDALEHFSNQFEITIVIDTAAFKEENAEVDVEATQVKLPKMTGVALGTALRLLLAQSPTPGTYVIHPSFLEVTTMKAALTDRLVQQQVMAKFDKVPLEEALEALADSTGASVIVDGRVGDKAKTPVTATFKNNLSLEAAVGLLANMADLKSVVIESGLYVTTKENAAALQAEQKKKKARVFERPQAAGA